jgi:UPF0716 protein FxsA
MILKLFLLFTIVPIIELALLIKIGSHIGVIPTIAIVILTGIFGASLARYEGLTVLNKLRSTLAEGDIPTDELIEGMLIFVGGALLLTPGFITDIFGYLSIIPYTRRIIREYLKKYFKNKIIRQNIHIDMDN